MIPVFMKKPFIGISANLYHYQTGPLPYVEICGLSRDYLAAVDQAGGIPLMLPVVKNRDVIREQVSIMDGIILSGGYDVGPSHYGEEPTQLLEETHPERDAYELAIIQIAEELKKPIFGICRGMQIF